MRWRVVRQNPLCSIFIHRFLRGDEDAVLHDHPWSNASFILEGEYTEVMADGPHLRRAGMLIARKAGTAHRIELHAGEAWTLFMCGPRVREWGFHCPRGWRHWREYVMPNDPDGVGPGCD